MTDDLHVTGNPGNPADPGLGGPGCTEDPVDRDGWGDGGDWGDDGGLRPQLDAYAADRLRADPARTDLVRARVMAEARRVGAAGPADARRPADGGRARRAGPRTVRRLLLAAAAIVVILAMAGGALAGSGPGGPTYAIRLWIEEATLPADSAARLEAQLARLDARLREAGAAAAQANGPAVTAALDTYRAIVDAAASAAGVDVLQREHVAAELGRHVAVLRALRPEVPARAAEAISAAVDRTALRIEEILTTPPDRPVEPGRPAGPGRSGDPAPPQLTPTPTHPRATPEKTPRGKPEATPRVPATPKTPATPRPDRTPPGQGTETPRPTH